MRLSDRVRQEKIEGKKHKRQKESEVRWRTDRARRIRRGHPRSDCRESVEAVEAERSQ